MRVPPNPLGRALDVAGQGPETARRVAALLPRAVRILDTADRLLARIDAVLDRLEQCEARISQVVERVASTEREARGIVDDAARVRDRLAGAIDEAEPDLQNLRETLVHAGRRLGPAQVDAFAAYLDFLPLLQKLDRELLPTVATLNTVAPDLTELVAVSKGLNELMGSLPGLGRVKKRVDEELADDARAADGRPS